MITVQRWLLAGLVALGLLVSGPVQAAEEKPLDLETLLTRLEFKPSQKANLVRGQILSNDPGESTAKELAVTVVALMPAPMDKTVGLVKESRVFELNREILQFGEIQSPPVPKDFATLTYQGKERETLARFLRTKAGSEFNLSREEFDSLADLRKDLRGKNPSRDAQAARTVQDAYVGMLLERTSRYQKEGLKGVAPYQRKGRKVASPAEELGKALAADAITLPRFQYFIDALKGFPKAGKVPINSQYFWFKQNVEDKPTLILAHRMLAEDPKHTLMAQRQFYVGQSYNVSQVLVCFFEVPEGTAVAYRIRTSTDQVTGLGGGLRVKIGRELMRKEVIKRFEVFRKELSQ